MNEERSFIARPRWDVLWGLTRQLLKAETSANVLAYEPGIALFVPDNDPLILPVRICMTVEISS